MSIGTSKKPTKFKNPSKLESKLSTCQLKQEKNTELKNPSRLKITNVSCMYVYMYICMYLRIIEELPDDKSVRERWWEEGMEWMRRWNRLMLGCSKVMLQSGCRPTNNIVVSFSIA